MEIIADIKGKTGMPDALIGRAMRIPLSTLGRWRRRQTGKPILQGFFVPPLPFDHRYFWVLTSSCLAPVVSGNGKDTKYGNSGFRGIVREIVIQGSSGF